MADLAPGVPRSFIAYTVGYPNTVITKGGPMTEVVALFATKTDAETAIDELSAMGYDASSVGYINRGVLDRDNNLGSDMSDTDIDDDAHEVAAEGAKGVAGGAVGGAAVGVGAGLLASAGLALVPGIGPFLAAGTLLGTLGAAAAGAAGGAVLGGVAGAIFGAATDDEASTYYREGVQEGGSLVTVNVNDDQVPQVTSLLRNAGAKKVDAYGNKGWMV
jgi:hypothetical protein